MTKCIVLSSSEHYSKAQEGRLRKMFLKESPELVATVGVDCEAWEEALDYLCVELDASGKAPGAFCNTTSHPKESIDSVVKFVEQWCYLKECTGDVRVIEI